MQMLDLPVNTYKQANAIINDLLAGVGTAGEDL